MNKDIEQRAEEYAKGKSSSEVFRDAHIKDYIAGATEERERGKRFAEWCLLNAEIIDPNLYYMVDETGTKKYTVNDLFDMYMERENKALNN